MQLEFTIPDPSPVQRTHKPRHPKVERTCEICGKHFFLNPAKVAKGNGRFCSRACRGISQHKGDAFTCKTCGNAFHRKPYSVTRKSVDTSYCSRLCRNKHRDIREAERFWTYVNKDGPIPPHDPSLGPCWEFTGGKGRRGYGKFAENRKTIAAHRYGYKLQIGPIPPGLFVCHECDNPPCVRGSHLHLGTSLSNVRERVERGRGATGDANNTRRHPEIVRGIRNPSAKLTEEQVREIRARYIPQLVSLPTLASEYGVSSTLIRFIVTRKIWRHI